MAGRLARLSRVACAAVAALVVGGCGGGGESSTPTPTEVTGLVRTISREGDRVERFSVRADGRTYVLETPRDVDYGFDLGHLAEHRDTGDPVRCTVERRGNRLVATAIYDA